MIFQIHNFYTFYNRILLMYIFYKQNKEFSQKRHIKKVKYKAYKGGGEIKIIQIYKK